MVSSSPYGSETMQAEALLREVDLPNYISDVHDLLRGAILGAPLPKRELEKVAQVIINRAIEDWGNRAAYSVAAARILAFISEREEAKAREIRKAWGEPDPPFALRSVMSYIQEVIGEKESFKKMSNGWDKWYSFLSCILHFFQFNAVSPVLSTSVPTMLTTQTWRALRELTDWNPKKTNAEKIAIQMYLLKSFFTSKAGMLLHDLDKKNMEDFTNLLRDKFSDPNLTDEAMLEVFMDIFEARASWRKLPKASA